MKKQRLKISPKALHDIQETVIYYNKKQKGLGKRFAKEAHVVIKQIQEMPQVGSVSHKNIRYQIIPKFPFIITYQFDDKTINIARVFNTYQNPDKKY